jgi:hypothetical protein
LTYNASALYNGVAPGSYYTEDEAEVYSSLYVELGMEVLVPSSGPIGIWFAAGYRQFLTRIEEAFQHASVDSSYSELQGGVVVSGGVRVLF